MAIHTATQRTCCGVNYRRLKLSLPLFKIMYFLRYFGNIMKTLNRQLGRHSVIAFSSNFEQHGFDASTNWRYDLLTDYLKISPSYIAYEEHTLNRLDEKLLPRDWKKVAKIHADFGTTQELNNEFWWYKVGMRLYGVSAPRPKVEILEVAKSKAVLSLKPQHYDCVILSIPTTLTRTEVLKELKKHLQDIELATSTPETIKYKYKLVPSKLQKKTLIDGKEALRLYRNNVPLWKIGNILQLSLINLIDESKITNRNEWRYAERKLRLAAAASKLVRKAVLISENAARGRFPCDDPLPYAFSVGYTRPAGRPATNP